MASCCQPKTEKNNVSKGKEQNSKHQVQLLLKTKNHKMNHYNSGARTHPGHPEMTQASFHSRCHPPWHKKPALGNGPQGARTAPTSCPAPLPGIFLGLQSQLQLISTPPKLASSQALQPIPSHHCFYSRSVTTGLCQATSRTVVPISSELGQKRPVV